MNSSRSAWICTHKSHLETGYAYRVFMLPGEDRPRCPEHGAGTMKVQANRPYHPDSAAHYGRKARG